MVIVIALLIFFGDALAQARSNFPADHLLHDDLIALVLLEVFEGDALRGGRLLQVVQRFHLHFLAHVVEPLEQFGVAGNAQVGGFFQKELVIDKIAQNSFFTIFVNLFRIGGIVLQGFLSGCFLAVLEVGEGDNPVVDPGTISSTTVFAAKAGRAARQIKVNRGISFFIKFSEAVLQPGVC